MAVVQCSISECNLLSDCEWRKGDHQVVREGLSGQVNFKLKPKRQGVASTNILGQVRVYCASVARVLVYE